jgi:hypothetical protein
MLAIEKRIAYHKNFIAYIKDTMNIQYATNLDALRYHRQCIKNLKEIQRQEKIDKNSLD